MLDDKHVTNYIIAVDFGTMRTQGRYTIDELRTVKTERRRLADRELSQHGTRATAPSGWRWVDATPEPGQPFVCGVVRP